MNAVSGISRLLTVASLGLVGGCISTSDCDGDDDCAGSNGACRVERCVDDNGRFVCAAFDEMDGTDCTLEGDESGTCVDGACESGTGGTGGTGGAGGSGGTGGTGGTGGVGGMAGTGGTGGSDGLPEQCSGGEDEDGDQLVDCEDVFDCACTPACIELFLEECQPTNLLTNPGFEQGPTGSGWTEDPGFPTLPAIWGGDLAEVVVGPVSGINPLEGTYMMQFQSTFDQPVPTDSASSERVQLVDANDYRGSRICGVASFARVSGDPETDTRFAVVTAWYQGSPADFDGFTSHITTQCFEESRCGNGQVDIEADSWVRASSTTVLPEQGTLTAVVMVRAQEDVYNDTDTDEGPELDGHFVDDVSLFVVPDQPCGGE